MDFWCSGWTYGVVDGPVVWRIGPWCSGWARGKVEVLWWTGWAARVVDGPVV